MVDLDGSKNVNDVRGINAGNERALTNRKIYMQMKQIEIIDVNAGNVEDAGFFCYMSKRKWPVALV